MRYKTIMKNCNMIRDLLPLYEDNETRPETTLIIKEHLEECEACREYYSHICHVARSMKNPPKSGKYQYSAIARRIRRRNTLTLSAGCISFLALGYLAGHILFPNKD